VKVFDYRISLQPLSFSLPDIPLHFLGAT